MANIKKKDPLALTMNVTVNEEFIKRFFYEKSFEDPESSNAWFWRKLATEAMDEREKKREKNK